MTRMTGPEVLEEVDWLMGGGTSPFLVPTIMRRSPQSIEQTARRYGRTDIANTFNSVYQIEKRRKRVAA